MKPDHRRCATGAGLTLLLFLAAVPAAAATRTYSSAPAVVIPDALPPGPGTARSVTDTIEVPDGGTVLDVDVEVSIRHPGHGDLSIDLTDPGGAVTVRLIQTEGGPGDGLSAVTFDDEATTLPPGFVINGTCLVDQVYRPAPGSLADFDGLNAAGTWILEVTDHFSGDAGDCDCDGAVVGPPCPRTLDEWSLTIDIEPESSAGDARPRLSCHEILLLLGAILVMVAILWLLVSKTRP